MRRTKPWQIGLLWTGEHSESTTGCPIGGEERDDVEAMPEAGANQRKQSGEAVAPATQMGEEAHQQVSQQRGPYLPLDCLLVVADEINQLHRLFDLLEKRLFPNLSTA